MIHNDLLDPDIKGQIDNFDEYLEKCLDGTKCVDDVRANFYIDDVDESTETEHGYGDNTLSDEAYGDIMTEECTKQDTIEDASHENYIGSETIMDMLGEVLKRATFRCCVGYLNREKVRTYHRNPLIYTREYELEYDDRTHDTFFANVISENLYSRVNSEGHHF